MTLLIDIERPDGRDPLRFMCGNAFEVIGVDPSGLEIYGKKHAGKEYLFFPLDFRPLKAGVLGLRFPAEYTEWFMGRDLDGARIVFSAPHGQPFFPGMPEEYRSSAGILRVEGEDSIRIHLDRIDPEALAEEMECGGGHEHGHDAACGCGQRHDQTFGNRSRCGCRNQDAERTIEEVMPDHALAEEIRSATDALDVLLDQAAGRGLRVDLCLRCPDGREETFTDPRLRAQVYRPL